MSGSVNVFSKDSSSSEADDEQRFSFVGASEVAVSSSSRSVADDPSISQDSDSSHYGRLVIDESVSCEVGGSSASDREDGETAFCEVGAVVEDEVMSVLSDGVEEVVETTILTTGDNAVVARCEEDRLNPSINDLIDNMEITAEELGVEDSDCERCLNPLFALLQLQCAWHGRENDENHSSESSQALCNEDGVQMIPISEISFLQPRIELRRCDGALRIPFSEISFVKPCIELRRCDERPSGSGRRRGRPALYPRGQSPWLRRSVRPAGRPRIHPVGHRPAYIRTGRPAGRPRKESRVPQQSSSDDSD
ncbi:hypothetical protein V9T40_008804 [Parthenolecanium corni]|uniref:Uncharacterized protein n=1 Tax=Parthenolecanium corni TaxID=536013 RepID=A0AAN9TNT3_9HEMI